MTRKACVRAVTGTEGTGICRHYTPQVMLVGMSSRAANHRRSLTLDHLSQVVPEVERVRPAHRTVGLWSLAQICKHLADSINGSIDGFDLSNHRFKRFFLARRLLQYTFRYGIPAGYTVDSNLTPPPSVDLSEAVGALTRAVERYAGHSGPLQAHPLFGKMPRDVWDRVHCFHCAHHLSFVLPTEDQ